MNISMASFQKTLNVDAISLTKLYVRGALNSNMPVNTVLTSDGNGGTFWTSTFVGDGTRVDNVRATGLVANLNYDIQNGVFTASSFIGDGSYLTDIITTKLEKNLTYDIGHGKIFASSITASTFFGDGSGLSNIVTPLNLALNVSYNIGSGEFTAAKFIGPLDGNASSAYCASSLITTNPYVMNTLFIGPPNDPYNIQCTQYSFAVGQPPDINGISQNIYLNNPTYIASNVWHYDMGRMPRLYYQAGEIPSLCRTTFGSPAGYNWLSNDSYHNESTIMALDNVGVLTLKSTLIVPFVMSQSLITSTASISSLNVSSLTGVYANISSLYISSYTGVYANISSVLISSLTGDNANISSLAVSSYTGKYANISTVLISSLTGDNANISSLEVSSYTGKYANISTVFISSLTGCAANISSLAVSSYTGKYANISSVLISSLRCRTAIISSMLVSSYVGNKMILSSLGINCTPKYSLDILGNLGISSSTYDSGLLDLYGAEQPYGSIQIKTDANNSVYLQDTNNLDYHNGWTMSVGSPTSSFSTFRIGRVKQNNLYTRAAITAVDAGTNNNYVGINCNVPIKTLDVNGTINTNSDITCGESTSKGVLRFVTRSGVSYIESGKTAITGSAQDLVFTNMNNSGSETMRLNISSQYVGINCNVPICPLDVNGRVNATSVTVGSVNATGLVNAGTITTGYNGYITTGIYGHITTGSYGNIATGSGGHITSGNNGNINAGSGGRFNGNGAGLYGTASGLNIGGSSGSCTGNAATATKATKASILDAQPGNVPLDYISAYIVKRNNNLMVYWGAYILTVTDYNNTGGYLIMVLYMSHSNTNVWKNTILGQDNIGLVCTYVGNWNNYNNMWMVYYTGGSDLSYMSLMRITVH